MVKGTIEGMTETSFGDLIYQYAPDELHLFDDLRVFIDDTGNFWFIGSEIANIMGYENTRDALLRHVPEEYKRGSVVKRDGTLGGNPNVILISELGLYALAMRSQLPQAYKFQDWVYRVISRIRQYGGYISPNSNIKQVVDIIPEQYRQSITNMIDTKNRVIDEQQKQIENLNKQIYDQRDKVEFYDLAMANSNAVPITVIAKDFGMTANRLHNILSNLEIIYRVKDTWVLHKQYQDQGFTATKSKMTVIDVDGKVHDNCEIATYWTEKGRVFIYNNLMSYGYKPLYLA